MKELVGIWNYYFLRYAAPSVIGAYAVMILIEGGVLCYLRLPCQINLTSLDAHTGVMLLVLGFAYCYIASAPILLLHALRGMFSGRWRCSRIAAFYRRLASARSRGSSDSSGNKNKVSEYVESYRHLREHGNAFLIILLEIVLALLISWVYCEFGQAGVVVLLLVWVSLGASCWGLATCLEFHIPPTLPTAKSTQ